jgi:hypothetical protein
MTEISRRTLLKGSIASSAALAASSSLLSALPVWSQQTTATPTGSDHGRLDLNGEWTFNRDDEARGIAENWFAGALPVGLGARSIVLPGTTDEARVGHANPHVPSLSGLYRENTYTGPAWYQREIEIPEIWRGKSLSIFLERIHWVTHAWLDGKALGTQESLISPHIYDLGTEVAPGKHLLTICVDNTLIYDLGRFVSVYFEGTQTNWNGVIGRMEIVARDPVHVASVRVVPDVDRKLARVEMSVRNASNRTASSTIRLQVRDAQLGFAGMATVQFSAERSTTKTVEAEVAIGPDVKLWDEFTPHLYTLEVTLGEGPVQERVTFGMRKLAVQGKRFTLNGRPLLLRGTLECGIFPLTGYPPTDLESWRRIFQIEKSYGLNFIRFHSWTPPQAAFAAADIEGVFIQTEGPQANVQTGEVPRRDAFVERELLRIPATYGNHPSFILMAIGNEFGGSMEIVTRWVDLLMKSDDRHLYTTATSNALKSPNRQWTEDRQMRGVHGPTTDFDYDNLMSKEDRPFIGHEIAQWTFYPDLDETRKYTGVLKAKNFELIRRDLQEKGMLDQARLFLEATGKQAILLYKDEIECIIRTRDYAGYSLLDIHDYPGQGTAMIGFLDAFWDSKGLIRPAEHRGYAGATVPLLRMPKRTYTQKEAFEARVEISHFGQASLPAAETVWSITNEDGALVSNGSLPPQDVKTGQLTPLGKFSANFDRVQQATKLVVNVGLKGRVTTNKWDIWVYPERSTPQMPDGVVVCAAWGPEARTALAAGKKVVIFQSTFRGAYALKGSFLPVFWSPVWFDREPATMGILVNPDHPIFAEFPTDLYSNWQWHSLIEGSHAIVLDSCPKEFRPLVQVVDNFSRNHRLGSVFEAKVGPGKLLVCSLQLNQDAPDNQTPEQRAMLASIASYVGSQTFAPTQVFLPRFFDGLLATS